MIALFLESERDGRGIVLCFVITKMHTPLFLPKIMCAKYEHDHCQECAKACQNVVDGGEYDGWQQYAAAACRDEIRARGEKGQS